LPCLALPCLALPTLAGPAPSPRTPAWPKRRFPIRTCVETAFLLTFCRFCAGCGEIPRVYTRVLFGQPWPPMRYFRERVVRPPPPPRAHGRASYGLAPLRAFGGVIMASLAAGRLGERRSGRHLLPAPRRPATWAARFEAALFHRAAVLATADNMG
jgi:hypothetical protein